MAGGTDDGYAIGSDGNLYAWGWNGQGELGIGNNTGPDAYPLNGPGQPGPTGACSTTPVKVDLPSGVTATAIATSGAAARVRPMPSAPTGNSTRGGRLAKANSVTATQTKSDSPVGGVAAHRRRSNGDRGRRPTTATQSARTGTSTPGGTTPGASSATARPPPATPRCRFRCPPE